LSGRAHDTMAPHAPRFGTRVDRGHVENAPGPPHEGGTARAASEQTAGKIAADVAARAGAASVPAR